MRRAGTVGRRTCPAREREPMNYCSACKRHLNDAVSCPGCGARDRELDRRLVQRRGPAGADPRTPVPVVIPVHPDAETTLRLPPTPPAPVPIPNGHHRLIDVAPDHGHAAGRRRNGLLVACAIAVPVIVISGVVFTVASGGQPSAQPAGSAGLLSSTSAQTDSQTPTSTGSSSAAQATTAPQETVTATPTRTRKPIPKPTATGQSASPSPSVGSGGGSPSRQPPASPTPTCTKFLFWCN
jgi:hypothetical protein